MYYKRILLIVSVYTIMVPDIHAMDPIKQRVIEFYGGDTKKAEQAFDVMRIRKLVLEKSTLSESPGKLTVTQEDAKQYASVTVNSNDTFDFESYEKAAVAGVSNNKVNVDNSKDLTFEQIKGLESIVNMKRNLLASITFK